MAALKENSKTVFNYVKAHDGEDFTAKGIPVVVYEPSYKEEEFFGSKVIKNLEEFKKNCDVIVSNRMSPELADVKEKVYTRDLYSRD